MEVGTIGTRVLVGYAKGIEEYCAVADKALYRFECTGYSPVLNIGKNGSQRF